MTAAAPAPDGDEVLVLVSRLAFYPVHWQALEQLVDRYRVRAVVLAAPDPELPAVHRQLGTAVPNDDDARIEVRRMPELGSVRQLRWLRGELGRARPDAIWIQEEPTDPLALETLALRLFERRTRIGVAVCENIFPAVRQPNDLARRALWRRVDALLAVASPSVDGIRSAGMPARVVAHVPVAGALAPPAHVEPLRLPFERRPGDFVIGFAGSLSEEKGWSLLFDALEKLPDSFRLLLAGDGPQRAELEGLLTDPRFDGRAFFVGLLPKERLWGFYSHLDVLAVPSLTRPAWMEQFGGVLADAMAMGVPLVGSSSGSIPEVVGPAGLVVPEGDAEALTAAFIRLEQDSDLRARLAGAGPPRFTREFAVPAYAARIADALSLRPRETG